MKQNLSISFFPMMKAFGGSSYAQKKLAAGEYPAALNESHLGGETEISVFTFGVIADNVHTANEQFAFIRQSSFMFDSRKQSDVRADEDEKGNALECNVAFGVAFVFNQNWALELESRRVGSSDTDSNKGEDDDVKSLQIALNVLSPSAIGIRYHI